MQAATQHGRTKHAGSLANARKGRGRRTTARSCVGCGQRVELARARIELIRLVFVPPLPGSDGRIGVVPDIAGARSAGVGRGAWVHARLDCVGAAVKRGLARAAKAPVHVDLPGLHALIAAQARRRAFALLSAAQRGGHAFVGSTAVEDAWRRGCLVLVLVAEDAAHAAATSAVRAAKDQGMALSWGTKRSLGEALARNDLAVVAVADEGIADALARAISLAQTFGSSPLRQPQPGQGRSTEEGLEGRVDDGAGDHE